MKWGELFISDVAEIISGRGIFDDERISGRIPYVTASAVNNGISYFIANTNETLESNCISVNSNGSVGYAFYHPYIVMAIKWEQQDSSVKKLSFQSTTAASLIGNSCAIL